MAEECYVFIYSILSNTQPVDPYYVAFSRSDSYKVLLSFQNTGTNILAEYRELFSLSKRCLPKVLNPMFRHVYQPECHLFLSTSTSNKQEMMEVNYISCEQ